MAGLGILSLILITSSSVFKCSLLYLFGELIFVLVSNTSRSSVRYIWWQGWDPLPASRRQGPSDNPMRLLASPSDITHNFLQVALASASFATSAILALSGSDPGPLSAPRSLAVTFAPSDLRTLGSSRTLGNNNSFCPPGSRRTPANKFAAGEGGRSVKDCDR